MHGWGRSCFDHVKEEIHATIPEAFPKTMSFFGLAGRVDEAIQTMSNIANRSQRALVYIFC